jgi:hypothetical protein
MSDDETSIYQLSKIPEGTLLLRSFEIKQFPNSGGMAWTYLVAT